MAFSLAGKKYRMVTIKKFAIHSAFGNFQTTTSKEKIEAYNEKCRGDESPMAIKINRNNSFLRRKF